MLCRTGAGKVPKTYTFDAETVQLLNTLVGHARGHGAFLSRLVHQEAARRAERDRLRHTLTTALAREE